ncbi:type II secretion system protein M [Hahella sp. HN01]|uniref:type II secretion system protein M n=1 Tax=Hahella sp. HN01 TaxID=2847262 RepID=UPI001C1EE541|nr:type II secretion system protein M [Hahella sp. HN01]MBU6952861.1 type II secretion system protein M [Hahella sp. HN01]
MMKKWIFRVNRFSLRERAILLATVIVALILLYAQFAWDPLWRSNRSAEQAIAAANLELLDLSAQADVLRKQLAQDPDAALRKENERLRNQLNARQERLKQSLSRLVAPEEMPELLMELLRKHPGLQVVAVAKLPPRKIQHGEGEAAAVLFSHRVKVVLTGGYFDTLQYIQKIERNESRLRIVDMDYKVDAYPRAEVTLEFETLGLDERWLGV